MPRRFKYCPHCATPFILREIHNGERMVCPSCNFIFWQNPVVGVAVIVMDGDRIILGRRARGIYKGAWWGASFSWGKPLEAAPPMPHRRLRSAQRESQKSR